MKEQIRFHLPQFAALALVSAPALHAQIAPGELVAPQLEISGGYRVFVDTVYNDVTTKILGGIGKGLAEAMVKQPKK